MLVRKLLFIAGYGPGRMGAFKLHERKGSGCPFNYTKARCISKFFKTVNTLFEIETEKTFLASRSFAISPLVLGTTVTLNKIEDSLQTTKIVLFLLYLLHPSYGDN